MSMPPAIASDSRTISAAEEFGVLDQCPGRRQGVASAGSCGQDAVAGLDHVARAADQQAVPRIDHRAAPPPAAGASGRSARVWPARSRRGDVVGIVLQLALEPLQQGEPVGRRPREAHQHLPLQQLAHLHRVGLHDLGAERHLPVAPHGHLAPLTHRENRRCMPVQAEFLRHKVPGPLHVCILIRLLLAGESLSRVVGPEIPAHAIGPARRTD